MKHGHSEENPLFVYKIITLGDPGIGKTCLTVRYCQEHYSTDKQATIGIDFKDKRILIDEIRVRLNIFDTAGQQSYNSLVKSYYREVDAVIFAYAITEAKSFENVRRWVREFESYTESNQAVRILVGTQCDRAEERVVEKEEGERMMQEIKAAFFFETSAKQNIQINNVFEEIARNLLLKMYKKRQKLQSSNKIDLIQMLNQEANQESKCC